MTDVCVTLEFDCCTCDLPVSVTVRCDGPMPGQDARGRSATVNVPCPRCGQVNHLTFEPSGRVRSVRPRTRMCVWPEPSVN